MLALLAADCVQRGTDWKGIIETVCETLVLLVFIVMFFR
jgi:hypothetical protein